MRGTIILLEGLVIILTIPLNLHATDYTIMSMSLTKLGELAMIIVYYITYRV